MNKDKQIENIKDIDVPEYQILTFIFSAVVTIILTTLMSFVVPIDLDNPIVSPKSIVPIVSPKSIVAYAVPAVVFVSSVAIFTLLGKKLTKTTIKTKDEKLIKFEDDSFVTTEKLSNRKNVGFVIKQGEHKIVGAVLPGDIKVSEEKFSYVNEITTETTSTIFYLSNKTENKKYLLYLSPETFDSVKSTFID